MKFSNLRSDFMDILYVTVHFYVEGFSVTSRTLCFIEVKSDYGSGCCVALNVRPQDKEKGLPAGDYSCYGTTQQKICQPVIWNRSI